jgi:hypothetical protein
MESRGRGRGAVKEEVSFTVHVHEPFEIYPGMECRAMVSFYEKMLFVNEVHSPCVTSPDT